MTTSQPTPAPAPTGATGATDRDDLVDALVQTAFATMAVLNKVGAEHDLSLTQLRVIAILRDRRLRMTALAAYLGLERSTMSGLVDRAEKRGLVERAPGASDGRAVEVFLSPGGLELAERLHTRIGRSLAPLTDALDHADRRRLQALLEQMLGVREP
ncbi:MarR family winged helix-turn-helix transcriptional regulator [Cellulomonas hominis]